MLNNKGYTLVELLATMIILGIVMAVTIPNISGISTQNKITTYAEDAKKFKSSAEYMIRGDDTIEKPKDNNDCVVVNLKYLHGNDYDHPPYDGRYLMDHSIMVMVKKSNRYVYYIQLVEEFNSDGVNNYKGFSLTEYYNLEGDRYLNNISEGVNMSNFFQMDWSTWYASNNAKTSILNVTRQKDGVSQSFRTATGCTTVKGIYYAS